MAARSGVGLDTVLRRYLAGYSLIGYYTVAEAGREEPISPSHLQYLLGALAVLFDRLIAAVSEEHSRETARLKGSSEQRRYERIAQLLAGEPLDTSSFNYDFTVSHIGLVAAGASLASTIRTVADALDCRLLVAPRHETTIWAWLGSRRPIDPRRVREKIEDLSLPRMSIGVGEPGDGLSGWRLTHRQAAAALSVASHRGDVCARYADVALLAAVRSDELLSTSLKQLYLVPLASESDGGESMRETLRAYLGASRNLTAAGAVLGISRQTVASRLRSANAYLGCPVDECAKELELALSLD